MLIDKLGIQEQIISLAQALDQVVESDLRSICLPLEHRLSKEGTPKGNAVESAD